MNRICADSINSHESRLKDLKEKRKEEKDLLVQKIKKIQNQIRNNEKKLNDESIQASLMRFIKKSATEELKRKVRVDKETVAKLKQKVKQLENSLIDIKQKMQKLLEFDCSVSYEDHSIVFKFIVKKLRFIDKLEGIK